MISQKLLSKLPRPTDTPAAVQAAPPKEHSADLEAALAQAEELLTSRDQAMRQLDGYHTIIPARLQQLTAAATAAERQTLRAEVDQLGRERQELIARLAAEEPQLTATRAELDTLRLSYSVSVVEDFRRRYSRAIEAVQTLTAEAVVLRACLRVEVPTPLPVHIEQKIEEPGQYPWWTPDTHLFRAAVLKTDLGGATAPDLPPVAARLGRALDGLDRSIAFTAGIKGHLRRMYDLGQRRYQTTGPFDPAGVFKIERSMSEPLTGRPLLPGQLVDGNLIPPALLLRAVIVKNIKPVVGA